MTPIQATSLSVSCCQHGTLSLNLHDKGGTVFASVSLDPATALHIADVIMDAVERHCDVAGHA